MTKSPSRSHRGRAVGKRREKRVQLHTSYEFRWQNFRGFADTGWVKIRPLTLLVGPNNSGKTSFISPLLLLSQTITAPDTRTPLIPRGPLIAAGSFEDFIRRHDSRKELKLGIRFHLRRPEGPLRSVGHYPPGAVELVFARGIAELEIRLKQLSVFDIYNRLFFRKSMDRGGRYRTSGIKVSAMRTRERRALLESKPVYFYFSPSSTLSKYAGFRGDTPPDPKAFSPQFSLYLQALAAVRSHMMSLFQDLSYIGPLRERPQRYYEASAQRPSSVGSRGQHAAQLLQRRFNALQSRLNKWIRAFGFGQKLAIHELSGNIFAIEFRNDGSRMNLADIGFGASQVLPLIVQALVAEPDTVTVAEQPEIHLNPRLQCLLADLFVEMAEGKRTVIVETHSEHLLLRLRRLIAERKISERNVAVYFVESVGSSSHIREVPIDPKGGVASSDWPKGFFEDSLRESLALATAQARG